MCCLEFWYYSEIYEMKRENSQEGGQKSWWGEAGWEGGWKLKLYFKHVKSGACLL